jgi:hypothetical protein
MDAIFGLLNNPIFLTVVPITWGLVVKYHPAWAKFPNAAIPYLTAILAFLVKLAAPAEAHAASGVIGAAGGILGIAASAGWVAVQNSLIYEVFLRTGLSKYLTKQT